MSRRRHAAAHDYPRGHVETVSQYLARGGTITPVRAAWSRHLTEEDQLLTILHGGDEADFDRGFAWSDLITEVRERVRQVYRDEDRTTCRDEWEWA